MLTQPESHRSRDRTLTAHHKHRLSDRQSLSLRWLPALQHIGSMNMEPFEPYFAEDTQGVHFGVWVDGQLILAHVGRHVLAGRFGMGAEDQGWVAVYLAHRHEIDSVVTAQVRANGPETVILRLQDLP